MEKPESQSSKIDWIVVRNDIQENFKDELNETTLDDYLASLAEPANDDIDPEGQKGLAKNLSKTLKTYIDQGILGKDMSLRKVIEKMDSL